MNLDDIDERLLFDDDFINSIYSKKEAAGMSLARFTIDSPDDAAIKESLSGEFVDYRAHRDLVYELKNKLKVAEEGLTVAYMHGFEKGKDKYKKALEEIYNEGSGNTRHLITLMAGEALGE